MPASLTRLLKGKARKANKIVMKEGGMVEAGLCFVRSKCKVVV